MKRITILLEEEMAWALRSLAVQRGEPVAALVREALAEYLRFHGGRVRPLSFVAAGRSGHSDIAERHEELLQLG